MSSNQKKAEKVSAKMARQEKEKNPADGAGKEAGKKRRGIRPAEQQRRMSSITRKLHWYWIRRRSVRFFFADLMVFLLACIGWCADREFARFGKIVLANHRSLVFLNETRRLVYRGASPEGTLLMQARAEIPLAVICAVTGSLFVLQLLGQFPGYFREDKKIRRILSPINEIALKADELSRLTFSEDKYQEIEKALEKIQPGQISEDKPLSFHDSDLTGVEAAMNNLLLRMRDSYRQQARFVNDASHELRTPIAVIQGYANLLDRWGKSDPQTLEEGISAIKNEADHMNHLVEQLLFLARGDSGKTVLELSQVNVCDLMREVYEESFMIDEAHRYRLQVPDEQILLTADPGLLKQAVRILTDNAAKYTKPGDDIILSAGRTDTGAPYLQVQDTGVGIAESEIPHIFERFYRSDEVRASAGTGLGLSIAKWIIDKHGGHFEILARPSLGTRIRIVIK